MFKTKVVAKVKFHTLAKVNKGKNVHRCKYCLELSTFRIIQINGINRLACIFCLNNCRYRKHLSIAKHEIIRSSKLNYKELVNRQWLRVKVYFTGNHIYGPFKRRRKK